MHYLEVQPIRPTVILDYTLLDFVPKAAIHANYEEIISVRRRGALHAPVGIELFVNQTNKLTATDLQHNPFRLADCHLSIGLADLLAIKAHRTFLY